MGYVSEVRQRFARFLDGDATIGYATHMNDKNERFAAPLAISENIAKKIEECARKMGAKFTVKYKNGEGEFFLETDKDYAIWKSCVKKITGK